MEQVPGADAPRTSHTEITLSADVYGDPSVRGSGVVETSTTMVGAGLHIHRRSSWAAIFGGVTMVIVVQLLLSMLRAGIGLDTVNLNAGSTPQTRSFGVGAGLWWVVSSCIALFFGGHVAAWLDGIEIRFDGVLQGLIAWGICLRDCGCIAILKSPADLLAEYNQLPLARETAL